MALSANSRNRSARLVLRGAYAKTELSAGRTRAIAAGFDRFRDSCAGSPSCGAAFSSRKTPAERNFTLDAGCETD
jgi:hypothetical protein